MQDVSHCVVQQPKSFFRLFTILYADRQQSISPKDVNFDVKTAEKRGLTLPLRKQNTRKQSRHVVHSLQHPSISPRFIAFPCAATLCTPSHHTHSGKFTPPFPK